MYDHIKKVEKYIGRKITVLKAPKSFDEYMFEHTFSKGKRVEQKGWGWPGPCQRWCTCRLKIDVTNRYIRELRHKKEPFISYIGIAADEGKRHEKMQENNRHPLFEWGVTEKQALEYCYSKGFNWGGLYEIYRRVSCWCCPLQPLGELRKLRKHNPELWEELKQMDLKAPNQFRADYSVQDLENKFAQEELQQTLF